MADQVIFKTAAFGGFDKAAVLSYVDQQQKAAQSAQEELQKKIAGLEQSGREMGALLEENKKQIMDLENALQAEQAKNREANSLINTLNLEIARQGRTLEQKNQEIRQQQEACRQFQFKAEAMEYKAQKFDEASLDIGTVILEAKQTASGILEGAETRSKEITAEAEQRMRTAAADTAKIREEVAQLKEMLGGVMAKMSGELDQLDGSLAATAERLENYFVPADEAPVQGETPQESSAEQAPGEDSARPGEKEFF